jgi:hypothetical protein
MSDDLDTDSLMGDKGKTTFSKISSSAKKLVFEYLYIVIGNESSTPLFFIFTVINYFQIYYFAFHPTVINFFI